MEKRNIYFLVAISLAIVIFPILGVIAQSNDNLNNTGMNNTDNTAILNNTDSLSTCIDSQVILTLSGLTNAHAGIIGSSNHSVKICYNSIFNKQYTLNNSQVCKNDSSNTVLILSGGKNAHAKVSNMTLNSGDIPVCYGDLSCKVVLGGCNSSIGEKRIIGLSDYDDAHLSFSILQGYEKNLCCTSAFTGGNTSLSINIIKPKMWENFTISQLVDFEIEIANSSSLTNDLDIIWDFGDGNITNINSCLSQNKCNTKHIYPSQAHYIIKAKVTRQNSSETSTDHVEILIYEDGLNKFAIISKPAFGEEIASNTPVKFNGNQSFIAQCGSSCPTGKTCYTIPNSQLSCYNFAKPNRIDLNGTLSDYFFWFNWTFDKGKNNADDKNIIGNWNLNYTGVVEFDRTFFAEGNHTAILRVGYEPSS
ncbi:MAG: hypothetical protein AABW91_00695 [Nanoarchaeota archaeon]